MATPEQLKKDFDHLIKTEKISHGYIFFGTSLSDNGTNNKLLLAQYISSKFEDTDKGTLIDNMTIDAIDFGGIDSIRSGIGFLWQKPLKSKKRILIINNAENLTLIAQQAILKIAEEPPKSALVILIVKDPGSLIAPLASRFQKVFFSETSRAELIKAYQFDNYSKDFFSADKKRRTEIIKSVIEEKRTTRKFIDDMLIMAYREREKNVKLLGSILERMCYIEEFNVNKKLQLEAALLEAKI